MMSQSANAHGLRGLPSIDRILAEPLFEEIADGLGRECAVRIARDAVALVRSRIGEGNSAVPEDPIESVLLAAKRAYGLETKSGTRRVINATGVIVHTNLGRSALSDEAIESITVNAGRYTTLEYDVETGKRGNRGEKAETLISRLTGAEAALIVNNCAAAAFLVLRVLAAGKDVIVSRGELVEIGGDFRIPDVLSESGASLREVGTTNRTKLKDYENAISDGTGLILRVHPSNFRVIGFTETPSITDLAELAHAHGKPFVEDAGSGALVDLSEFGLGDEPVISQSIAAGVDLVMFSGDKLLGGVQAGFIVGRADLIRGIRRHPLYRALRVDKISYAAIEATLRSYARERHFTEIPTLRLISTTAEELAVRARRILECITGDRCAFEIVEGESVIGGGSAPDVRRRTWLISMRCSDVTPEEIARRLRDRPVPVIARIDEDQVFLDVRTVFPDDESELIAAIIETVNL